MKAQTYFWILACLVATLVPACSRKIAVSPKPSALLTRTPTFTITPTFTLSTTQTQSFTPTETETATDTDTETPSPTPTETETDTFTQVPTSTETATETETSTDTETATETDTPFVLVDTDTPTETPTATSTETPTGPSIVCTVTPVAPTTYNEVELSTVGGPTGTNDNCATGEDIGTVSSGSDMEIHGSLFASGNNGSDYDYSIVDRDFYLFTAGSSGTYTLRLDCFTNQFDGNDFDILIYDTLCNPLGGVFTSSPVETISSPPLNPGDQFYFVIIGWTGSPQTPYRFTISGP